MASHPITAKAAPGGGVTLPPSQEKILQKFDLSIALTLLTWPALTLSVQNSWGGPNTAEKRDWFAGAISDLYSSTPNPDATIDVEYLEEFLLQVMNDEFEVNVEDGSGEEVAAKIVGLRKLCARGEFAVVDEMEARWRERLHGRGGGEKVDFRMMKGGGDDEEDEEEESDSEEEGVDDGDEDVEMGEAPELVTVSKEKVVPKVDKEGFTEVIGKKKRR
ncbi:MAG: hypothetical protein Q9169_008157 [Polycauliona sp. 2 TL-2023]